MNVGSCFGGALTSQPHWLFGIAHDLQEKVEWGYTRPSDFSRFISSPSGGLLGPPAGFDPGFFDHHGGLGTSDRCPTCNQPRLVLIRLPRHRSGQVFQGQDNDAELKHYSSAVSAQEVYKFTELVF